MATTPQYNFNVNRQDLDFILKQIKIAEVSTLPDGSIERQTLLDQIAGGPGAQVSSTAILPYGLRTVDGTWNHLLPGQERVGAADNVMPRLAAPNFVAADNVPPVFPGAGAPTTYASTSGFVFDSQPRLVSNLVVDQTKNNPAAVQAFIENLDVPGGGTYFVPGVGTSQGTLVTPTLPHGTPAEIAALIASIPASATLSIPNLSPDIGLSPPFNSWMTLFGQFFDHGLDLIDKGGAGTVFVPLAADDPLRTLGPDGVAGTGDEVPASQAFMVLTRATNSVGPGPDGVLGTPDDDTRAHNNSTTPFVDQNQTYTSHPSHQVFLREFTLAGGRPVATGHLLNHTAAIVPGGPQVAVGEGNWADVKAQAAALLGLRLTDADIGNVPLLATDRYGEFIPGPLRGMPQYVTGSGLVEGNLASPVPVPANAFHTNHAFLNDIAHSAVPVFADTDGNPATPPVLNPDTNTTVGASLDTPTNTNGLPAYDNELLDRHFITGDGRGNENIGLTAVHTIFHSEHNRMVEQDKGTILSQTLPGGAPDFQFINEWMRTPITSIPTTAAGLAALPWDGERLFQAARFTTEMQYQHLVFEEFARAVSPTIDPFVFSNSPDLDPAIFEEFANVVYRFGHSMLTETVARTNADGTTNDIGLIQAFLNPVAFNNGETVTEGQAVGAIVRGMTHQVGNSIDEFVTNALRNNLVGLPLDLAVLNMARARDTGVPTFNQARAQFYAMSGDEQLKPFDSWADMVGHLKHSASIVNFVAAYGTHPALLAATTAAGKRAIATDMVLGGALAPADSAAFLHSTGAWATQETGLNKVDLWIGGLAEFVNEFQGMLGPTFNFVFEKQLENLQNGDRFYYLSRTQGTNMLNQLENNTFSKLIMRNSDLGNVTTDGSSHLPSLVFGTPNYTLEVNQLLQSGLDPVGDDPYVEALNPMVQRVPIGGTMLNGQVSAYNFLKFSGGDHVVLGGSSGPDMLMGGKGIDSLWGDGGNDRLDGGDEADQVHGGDGDDIITDHGTPAGGSDFLHGDNGNDVISAGTGNDILFGGTGNDFIILGNDFTEVFAGEGNDFILGGNGPDGITGNEGDDWIEGGEGFDGLSGENSELFFNSPIIGHDVLNGQGNDTDYDGESGNDIMVEGPGIQRNNGMLGFDWAIHKGDTVAADSDLAIPFFPAQTVFTLRDRFDSVEALSGWKLNDHLVGTSSPTGAVGPGAGGIFGAPANGNDLLQKDVSLITGMQQLLGVLPVANPEATVFSQGQGVLGSDILIGGAGSDVIEGKAGNDLIDGDAWLNVRIGIAPGANPAPSSAESMNDIRALMIAGTINPGQLSIVREITRAGVNLATDVDVAVYNGPRTDYTITGLNGVPGVRDSFGQRIVRITDNVVAPVVIDGVVVPLLDDEGTDTLRGVEIARFITRDAAGVITNIEDVVISSRPPTGTATLAEVTPVNPAAGPNLRSVPLTPTVGQQLDSALSVITDPDSVTGTNPTGIIAPAAITQVWQSSSDGGATWVDVATGASFTPLAAQAGTLLRVEARFVDGAGFDEAIASAPTNVVGVAFTGTAANNIFVGTAGDDIASGLGGADDMSGNDGSDILNGDGGGDTLRGGAGDDILDGGSGDDILDGGPGADVMIGGTGGDLYRVDDVNDVVIETVAGPPVNTVDTTLNTYSFANGAQNNNNGTNLDNLSFSGTGSFTGTGNALANVLTGGSGNDVLNGDGGNDTLNGGAGNDTLNGGAGNTDTAVFSGAAQNYGFTLVAGNVVVTDNRALSPDGADTLTGVEILRFGTQNLTLVAGTNAAETLVGAGGSQLLLGFDLNDILRGLGGADVLAGGLGSDVFDYNAIGNSGTTAATRDIILDFVAGTAATPIDRIDVSDIDANGANAGDQTWAATVGGGTGSFVNNGQGQWRFFNDGTNTFVEFDLGGDGDAVADMSIQLSGIVAINPLNLIP